MAKFNIEVELDWVEEEAGYTIDEEIKEQVVRGVKDALLRKATDEAVQRVDNAKQLSYEADKEGITGFMYGAAVSILSQCWEYGEFLRKWHNKEYEYDGDGVVNPAVITVG